MEHVAQAAMKTSTTDKAHDVLRTEAVILSTRSFIPRRSP